MAGNGLRKGNRGLGGGFTEQSEQSKETAVEPDDCNRVGDENLTEPLPVPVPNDPALDSLVLLVWIRHLSR